MKKVVVILTIFLFLILPKGVNAAANTLQAKQVTDEKFWLSKSTITSITFENTINIPDGVTSWDVSEDQDSSVMAFIAGSGSLYIQANGTILANANSSSLFAGFSKVENVNGLNLLNTSNVTNMSGMFAFGYNQLAGSPFDIYVASEIEVLNLSSFDTSKVTNMSGMFHGLTKLTSLNLSSFNTSNVTSMSSMFHGCESLTTLDVSNFNTSKVTYMNYMFISCKALTSLNLSNFDTSKVTAMDYMFGQCKALTSLDISNFNTGLVEDVSYMFAYCESLTSLNLSHFNTTKIKSVYGMFLDSKLLSNINLSSFDFTNVTVPPVEPEGFGEDLMFGILFQKTTIIVKNESARTFIRSQLVNTEAEYEIKLPSTDQPSSSSSSSGSVTNPKTGVVEISFIIILLTGILYFVINRKKIFYKI